MFIVTSYKLGLCVKQLKEKWVVINCEMSSSEFSLNFIIVTLAAQLMEIHHYTKVFLTQILLQMSTANKDLRKQDRKEELEVRITA